MQFAELCVTLCQDFFVPPLPERLDSVPSAVSLPPPLMKNSQLAPPLLIPPTEGIKYAGSKLKLLPHILPMVCGLRGVRTVLDGFSGTTRVSQALYQTGRFAVTCNDLAAWSPVFARCYLQADRPAAEYQRLIDRLNALPGRVGWFTEHYGVGELQKYPFQRKNLERLDAIRDEIAAWRAAGEIDEVTESVLLTSLILALDRVDSTLGHFSSYLAKWSARSYGDLELRLPHLCYSRKAPAARVEQCDIFDLQGQWDLAYLDPPYGSGNDKMPTSRVRYASYYHFWTTVVRHDRPPIFGRAGRREDSRDGSAASVFEDFRLNAETGRPNALEAIDRMLGSINARYILLSYSSHGGATIDALTDILAAHGRLCQALSLDHPHHIMSRMQSTHRWVTADSEHKECLLLVEK